MSMMSKNHDVTLGLDQQGLESLPSVTLAVTCPQRGQVKPDHLTRLL